ncbi:hypothetical protein BpHYR1_048305 [Brachionus plicatilis]|uniref:Uncharacterized protein n=1 Tax=Brachionus plicatilis TaxID=10195 RepID=A0A3M7Q988_BRAPC|nr:hypothetical protein BpHYR1_048305 [Brachionus plicatilis]
MIVLDNDSMHELKKIHDFDLNFGDLDLKLSARIKKIITSCFTPEHSAKINIQNIHKNGCQKY